MARSFICVWFFMCVCFLSEVGGEQKQGDSGLIDRGWTQPRGCWLGAWQAVRDRPYLCSQTNRAVLGRNFTLTICVPSTPTVVLFNATGFHFQLLLLFDVDNNLARAAKCFYVWDLGNRALSVLEKSPSQGEEGRRGRSGPPGWRGLGSAPYAK